MAGNTRIWAGKTQEDEPAQERIGLGAAFALLLVLGTGLIALALLAVWSSTVAAIVTTHSSSAYPTHPTRNSADRYLVNTAGEPAFGPENALVTLVEFGDFQCPFCKRFFADVEQPLLDKYAGKIKFVFRDYPMPDMHPYAEIAAEAAHCAEDQHKFWEYHGLLFQNQLLFEKATLITYAEQLNLEIKTFEDCLSSGKHTRHVRANLSEGQALGVTGTPTFFINGRKLEGAQPLSAFSAYIDADLATLSR